jgi:homoserine dehydrogenase
MFRVTVLKFGSSVIRSADQLPDAIHEIYRHLRRGRRVVAVVSAFEGTTNRLLQDAGRFGAQPQPHALAELAATGERNAAAQLALALDQYGIAARLVDPREVELRATGAPLDAEPRSLDNACFAELLESACVLVIPGFFAIDDSGRCVLFGRGGSDQSALFLAQALGAECVLLKDVQGIYDHDPLEAGPATHRFEQISWPDAGRYAGKLVQPKALRFALEQEFAFRVSAAGFAGATTVGATTASPVGIGPPTPPLRIVLLGLGTVGLGVYRELARRPDLFDVRRIVVRHPARHVAAGIEAQLLRTDVMAAVAEPADLVVELLGGEEPAAAAIERALAIGRSVVTANKGLIAQRADWLAPAGRPHEAPIRYSAAVGGAVPMIEAVRRIVADPARAASITTIRGIVNGTCNFILEQLEQGSALEEAVALAQAKGFAEADPGSDLSGADAAAKLSILARLIQGRAPSRVEYSGIDEFTAGRARQALAAGRRLRLVATLSAAASPTGLRVSLTELAQDEWLARFVGEENALEIGFVDGPRERLWGRGAGRYPTTVSVMADIYDVWRAGQRSGRSDRAPEMHPDPLSAVASFPAYTNPQLTVQAGSG